MLSKQLHITNSYSRKSPQQIVTYFKSFRAMFWKLKNNHIKIANTTLIHDFYLLLSLRSLHGQKYKAGQYVGTIPHTALSPSSMMQYSQSKITPNTEYRRYCNFIADTAINSWISYYFHPKDVSDGSKCAQISQFWQKSRQFDNFFQNRGIQYCTTILYFHKR